MDQYSFCYWLQGYFELGGEGLSAEQVKIVKDNLAKVFNKVTPQYDLGTITIPQGAPYWSGNPPIFSPIEGLDNYLKINPPNWAPPYDSKIMNISC